MESGLSEPCLEMLLKFTACEMSVVLLFRSLVRNGFLCIQVLFQGCFREELGEAGFTHKTQTLLMPG